MKINKLHTIENLRIEMTVEDNFDSKNVFVFNIFYQNVSVCQGYANHLLATLSVALHW